LWLIVRAATPAAVVVLGIRWFWLASVNGIQENCEPHCVTDSEVSTALAIFLVVLGLWIVVLIVSFLRRRREDPFR
jgi:hypothetical protein